MSAWRTRWHRPAPSTFSIEGVEYSLRQARKTPHRSRDAGWREWVDDLLDRYNQLRSQR